MKEKLVLVIDDHPALGRSLALMTGHCFPVHFLVATTLQEAHRMFHEHKHELSAILVDGSVETRGTCDTLPLIKAFGESHFRGPVIAISNDRCNRKLMHAHGATDLCEKYEIRNKLEELLFTPKPKKHIRRR